MTQTQATIEETMRNTLKCNKYYQNETVLLAHDTLQELQISDIDLQAYAYEIALLICIEDDEVLDDENEDAAYELENLYTIESIIVTIDEYNDAESMISPLNISSEVIARLRERASEKTDVVSVRLSDMRK